MRKQCLSAVGPYRLLAPLYQPTTAQVLATPEGAAGALVWLDCDSVPHEDVPRQQALDEALRATRVRHPNVLSLLDVLLVEAKGRGVPDDLSSSWDLLVAVYEWVPAIRLDRLLRGAGPLPVAIAVALAGQLLAGLQAAHELEGPGGQPLPLCLRELSPRNLRIAATGRVLLLDLPWVDRLFHPEPLSPRGQLKGMRPLWTLSPERLDGLPLDPRDNLWSAVMILWSWLTGSVPPYGWQRATPQMIQGVPPSLAPAEGAPTMPPALLAVLERSVQPDRAARHATAAELRAELLAAVAPAGEAEVAAWAADRGLAALLAREKPGLFPSPASPEEAEGEARDYRTAPGVPSAPRAPSAPPASLLASSPPVPLTLWRRMLGWWARPGRP